jgi:uncharacterized membrane protein
VIKKDFLILIVPFIILGVAYPFLPDQIPRQFRLDGSVAYISKEFIFILGFMPYLIYNSIRRKRGKQG